MAITTTANTRKCFSKMVIEVIVIWIRIHLSESEAIACEFRHTNKPLHGLQCAATITRSVWQTAHPQCVWRCLQMKTCRFINHNSVTGQCDLGLSQCESLQPDAEFMVQAFGPPRHECLHWGSHQEQGRSPVREQNRFAARIVSGDVLLIGTFYRYGKKFWANKAGVKVASAYETDSSIEFLFKDADCPLPWMLYTAGEPLPYGAVTGGNISDGSATYLAKINHEGTLMFGYYDPKYSVAYYEHGGVLTSTLMGILVLLWCSFIVWCTKAIWGCV